MKATNKEGKLMGKVNREKERKVKGKGDRGREKEKY